MSAGTYRLSITGSSPLARGLLLVIHGVTTHGGIIPARAGFTVAEANSAARARDHPRSRGVYRQMI